MKRDLSNLKKCTLPDTKDASNKLPAGSGKFLLVTCGKRRQSLLAEGFACIRM